MIPATTALMLLKTHDEDLARARRGDLRRRGRRFQRHTRIRRAFA